MRIDFYQSLNWFLLHSIIPSDFTREFKLIDRKISTRPDSALHDEAYKTTARRRIVRIEVRKPGQQIHMFWRFAAFAVCSSLIGPQDSFGGLGCLRNESDDIRDLQSYRCKNSRTVCSSNQAAPRNPANAPQRFAENPIPATPTPYAPTTTTTVRKTYLIDDRNLRNSLIHSFM